MNADQWINFNKWMFGIYATGNVADKGVNTLQSNAMANYLQNVVARGNLPGKLPSDQSVHSTGQ